MRTVAAVCLAAVALSSPAAARQPLERVKEQLDEAVAAGRIGSAVGLVADHDRVLLLHAAGQLGDGIPMISDAIARLASITKPITAVAVLMLAERGRLGRTIRWSAGSPDSAPGSFRAAIPCPPGAG